MKIAPVRLYGDLVFRLAPDKEVKRSSGLDAVLQYWQTDRRDSFAKDSPAPDYPNMRVKECETEEEIPGRAYTHRLQCEGLLLPEDKIESAKIRQPEEGFDEGPMTTLTVRPDAHVQGMSHPLFPSLVLLEAEKERVNGAVWRILGTYKGIYGTKATKRRYAVNGKEVKANVAFAIAVPGVGTIGPANFVVPRQRVSITERFLRNGLPPTELVGKFLEGAEIPTDTPPIVISLADLVSDVSSRRKNFPYGWVIQTMQAERLLEGRLEHDVTIQYDWVPPAEMGGDAAV